MAVIQGRVPKILQDGKTIIVAGVPRPAASKQDSTASKQVDDNEAPDNEEPVDDEPVND